MALRHTLTEEQRLIAESASALFRDVFTSEELRGAVRDGKPGETARRALGDSGLLGVCAPDSVGGAGLGAVAALALAAAAGGRGASWPVSESIVAAKALAARQPAIAQDLIHARAAATFAGASDAILDGSTLSTRVDALSWGTVARWMLLPVQAGNARKLALIDLEDERVSLAPRKGIDPACPVARVVLDGVHVPGDRLLDVPAWRSLLSVLLASELRGAAETCLALSVDYMKVRKQFGQEIGRFQALKHIAANDALFLENMRLAVDHAAWAQDAGSEDAAMSLHIARQYCADAARSVAEDAIQCHGGIGFTWDYDLQLYLRRILRLGATFGTASEHREAIAAELIAQFSA